MSLMQRRDFDYGKDGKVFAHDGLVCACMRACARGRVRDVLMCIFLPVLPVKAIKVFRTEA